MDRADKTHERGAAPLIIVLALAMLGLGAWWYFANQPQEIARPPALTEEAKAYVRNLNLSGVQMEARQSYTGATMVEITGQITNAGDRVIERVELNCVFYDAYGQIVLRERVPIVRGATRPGETKAFRLPFETPPASWNNQMPQLVIAHIAFAG